MTAPRIIFEDTHLIVLSKPAGLLSQGEIKGDENLVDWLRDYLGRNYVGLVHRLDRNTSGLMVVAKRSKAANRLTESLQNGLLIRKYKALLVGRLEKPSRWEHGLKKDPKTNTTQVSPIHPKLAKDFKKSALLVKPLAHAHYQGHSITLAEFELETGRSHQIRAQAAAEGFPLLGDFKYGRKTDPQFPRPALHSYWISFSHPMTDETLTFEEDLPDDLKI